MIASLVLVLHLLGFVDANAAANFLFITGALLLFSEAFVPSFGLIMVNGMIALFVGYILHTGNHMFFGIPIDWSLFIGVALIELSLVIAVAVIYMRFKNRVATTGLESMVGEEVEIVDWQNKTGHVRIGGELWNAHAPYDFSQGDTAIIAHIDKLRLTLKPKE